jgi:hypothetical protein
MKNHKIILAILMTSTISRRYLTLKKFGIMMKVRGYIYQTVSTSLQSQFGRDLTIKKTNEDIAQIQRSTYISRDIFDPDILWIATNNCMINLLSGETKPFSHKFMCTTKISVFYDHGYPTGVFADFFRLVEGRKSRIMKFL